MAEKTWQVKGKAWDDDKGAYVDIVLELTTEEYERLIGSEVKYYRLVKEGDGEARQTP